MIKITLHPDTRPAIYSFDKEMIVIGAPFSQADLSFPGEGLQEVHVKIVEQEGRFFAINWANDPFVTLNGMPFGKKLLHSLDRLEIGKTVLQFEGIPHEFALKDNIETPQYSTDGEIPLLLDKALSPQNAPTKHACSNPLLFSDKKLEAELEDFDMEAELKKLDEWDESQLFNPLNTDPSLIENELNVDDIEALVKQAEELEDVFPYEEVEETPPQTFLDATTAAMETFTPFPMKQTAVPELTEQAPFKRTSIKDLYFKDMEEDSLPPSPKNENCIEEQTKDDVFNRAKMLWIVLGLVIVLVLVLTAFYINASEKSEGEEIRAAESVADIAMALTHAKMNHIIPQNQNWSDPEFLRNNLIAVLSAEISSLPHLDSRGQLFNSPYLLRIYTNEDLSHFLVMAQPAAGVLQWFIPKTTIVVDSHSMELRKTKDLKSLNRLLVNPTLNGTNAKEISAYIKRQTEIIPLASLAAYNKHLGFSPPKALALIRPGAENLIYNAPRYYRFGEEIMSKASNLSEDRESSHEIAQLQQNVRHLVQYPNIVLYSSQGIQTAIESQRSLALFVPDAKFLIAYLQFNSHGGIKNSHLLMDDNQNEIALDIPEQTASHHHSVREISLGSYAASSLSSQEPEPFQELKTEVLFGDVSHPLFFHLSALISARQQALQPISEQITQLVQAQTLSPSLDFIKNMEVLLEKYQTVDSAQWDKVVTGIARLYDEYSTMPLVDFMHYVKVSGLSIFTEKYKFQEFEKNEIVESLIEEKLQAIRDSHSLSELDKRTHEAAELITLNAIPDPNKVIELQNEVHNSVLKKLKAFILSSAGQLATNELTREGRDLLAKIMKMAWITDQEEYNYYLSEYDYLIKEQHPGEIEKPIEVISEKELIHDSIGPKRSHRI